MTLPGRSSSVSPDQRFWPDTVTVVVVVPPPLRWLVKRACSVSPGAMALIAFWLLWLWPYALVYVTA